MDLLTQVLLAVCFSLSLALYFRSSSSSASPGSGGASSSSGKSSKASSSKKKGKKGKGKAAPANPEAEAPAPAPPVARVLDEEKHADGNALVESTPHAAANANVAPKSAKKSKSKKEVPAVPAEPAPVSTPAAPSYAATAASPSASSPLANGSGAVRTNAERRQESARKAETVADDMVDRDVDPEPRYESVARIPARQEREPAVVRITQEEADEGWEGVKTKSKLSRPSESKSKSLFATTNPFSALPGASSRSALGASDDTPTRKQRQNAARNAQKKAAKEEAEADRLARLAAHRRELEKERIREFHAPGGRGAQAKKAAANGASKAPTASINERGALVWD